MDAYNPHLLQHLSQLHREESHAAANHYRLALRCPVSKGFVASMVQGLGAWLERAGRRMQGKTTGSAGALASEFPTY